MPATNQKMRSPSGGLTSACMTRLTFLQAMQTLQSVHWPSCHPWTEHHSSHGVELLKSNIILSGQSNKTQEPFSVFSVSSALLPYILLKPQWFIRAVLAALSMQWAKGTLGNFMIHDEASRIILDVCMCHCILIMASVSWKSPYTFKRDNLIFSPLSLLSILCWLILSLRIPVKKAIAYIVHLGFRIIKRRNRKWQRK